jgi:hypothetical protein
MKEPLQRRATALCLSMMLATSMAACASHGRTERAGRAVDHTIDHVDRGADQAADNVKDAANRGADKVDRAVDELKN